MTNNGKSFTYLFKTSSKSGILIRRIEISHRLVQNGALITAFLVFSTLLTGGIYGVVTSTEGTHLEFSAVKSNPAASQLAVNGQRNSNTPDYTRPETFGLALNSGGPIDTDDADSDQVELNELLRSIQAKTDPSFLPTIWAHLGKINNEFGFRRNPFGGRTYEFHAGMDIDGERGETVIAPGNGTVIEAGWKGGYGNMIEIDHGNGLTTRYGHLSKIAVEIGQSVTRGQEIGLIGSTGRSTGPHLHYELRVNEHPINPRFFLPPEPTELVKPVE